MESIQRQIRSVIMVVKLGHSNKIINVQAAERSMERCILGINSSYNS